MPATPSYDLVKDDQDLRVPLHAEQVFIHGISFQAKLIGWREVPRPNSRTEIVQAMRRIRYECKVQNSKKQKVTIQISVDGVKILLKKKKRKKKQQWPNESDAAEMMHHPIYRIFYVSHDNSDLKIFSYIARDGSTDTFKCLVFKSNKKSQAMRVVRTVGQAFEVCHKVNLQKNSLDVNHGDGGERSDSPCELSDRCSEPNSDREDVKKEHVADSTQNSSDVRRPTHLDVAPPAGYNFRKFSVEPHDNDDLSTMYQTEPTTFKEMQQLRELLDQQTQQTRQALTQLVMLRDQLITETNARIEAQARTQQLLQQNRELLEHLATYSGFSESERHGLTAATLTLAPQSQKQHHMTDPATENLGSPLRKTFLNFPSDSNHNHQINNTNTNTANLNQQFFNHQLNTLSQQISGLTSQHTSNHLKMQQYPIQSATGSVSFGPHSSNNNPADMQHQPQQQHPDNFQVNQELLHRLQCLAIGYNQTGGGPLPQTPQSYATPPNPVAAAAAALLFGGSNTGGQQQQQQQQQPRCDVTSSMNHLLASPQCNAAGNLTPSPIMMRSLYSSVSPSLFDDSLGVSVERSLDRLTLHDGQQQQQQQLQGSSQHLGVSTSGSSMRAGSSGRGSCSSPFIRPLGDTTNDCGASTSTSPMPTRRLPAVANDQRGTTGSSGDYVTLRVTDESGNVTNTRRISATPSNITRTTSEKVPNRSQLMSEVQRTTWARHTTK